MLKQTDKFTVMIGESLSIDDYNVLSLLYMPIIGKEAYGLYMLLYSIANRNNNKAELTHSDLVTMSKISIKSIPSVREKLEGVDLLHCYLKDKEYAYLLKAPQSAQQFFHDGVLCTYLCHEVGNDVFDMLISYFRIEKFNKEGYKNMTKTFDVVFKKLDDAERIDDDGYMLSKTYGSHIKMGEINFDYDRFVDLLNLSVLEKQEILSTDLEEKVISIAFSYGFTEEEMQKIFYRSFVDGIVSFTKLAKEAKLYKKITEQPKKTGSGLDRLKSVKARDIAKMILENPSASNLKTIELVLLESPFDIPITNIALFHALTKYNKNRETKACPGKEYFFSVFDTFEAANVKTFEDAVIFVEKQADFNGQDNNGKTKPNNDSVKKSEWLKNYEETKEEEKKKDDEELKAWAKENGFDY